MSEKVLAVAAGHEITEGEVNDLIKNYPPEQQIYMSSPQAKQQVLEQVIAFHLFHQMAIDEKIPESKEYKEMIEKMQVELASHMAATSVIENITLDEAEEKALYEENPDLFVAKPQVSAKHILVDSEDSANDIAKEIAEGLAFEEAAKKYSTCPSKEQGGDLGYFSKGQMVPEFEKAAFEGEVGKVIGPVQTQFGYHLIRVEDKKDGAAIPFEQVKDQIHQQLIQTKQKEVYDAKVKELETKYGVERKDA